MHACMHACTHALALRCFLLLFRRSSTAVLTEFCPAVRMFTLSSSHAAKMARYMYMCTYAQARAHARTHASPHARTHALKHRHTMRTGPHAQSCTCAHMHAHIGCESVGQESLLIQQAHQGVPHPATSRWQSRANQWHAAAEVQLRLQHSWRHG